MALYPSLEDMKLDQLIQAQNQAFVQHAPPPTQSEFPTAPQVPNAALYPALGNYMGLELTEEVIAMNMPEYTVAVRQTVCLIYFKSELDKDIGYIIWIIYPKMVF